MTTINTATGGKCFYVVSSAERITIYDLLDDTNVCTSHADAMTTAEHRHGCCGAVQFVHRIEVSDDGVNMRITTLETRCEFGTMAESQTASLAERGALARGHD